MNIECIVTLVINSTHNVTDITHTTALASVQGASQQQQQQHWQWPSKTPQQLSESDHWSGDQRLVISIQEHVKGIKILGQ